MNQQLLHDLQTRSSHDEMAGERVPQQVSLIGITACSAISMVFLRDPRSVQDE